MQLYDRLLRKSLKLKESVKLKMQVNMKLVYFEGKAGTESNLIKERSKTEQSIPIKELIPWQIL